MFLPFLNSNLTPIAIFFDDEPEPKDDEEDSDDEFSDIEELRKKADLDLRGEGVLSRSYLL